MRYVSIYMNVLLQGLPGERGPLGNTGSKGDKVTLHIFAYFTQFNIISLKHKYLLSSIYNTITLQS